MMRIVGSILLIAMAAAAAPVDRGGILYRRYCGGCHQPQKAGHTPDINFLREMPAEAVLLSLERGLMKSAAEAMTDAERRSVAEFVSGGKLPQPLATMRVDYMHRGNASEESFVLDGVYREGPWPGSPDRREDTSGFGKYRFVVREAGSGRLVYSRGFASIYGEWETTAEAKEKTRDFSESVRFPFPAAPVELTIEKRDGRNEFASVWNTEIQPDAARAFVSPARGRVWEVVNNGEPAGKVDLLLLGDGYTEAEMKKWHADARRVAKALFAVSPFRERKDDFNVWAIDSPASESGVSRPSDGIERDSPVGAAYDAFGSERYVLVFDNKRLRDIAAAAPYEFLLILVNDRKYGGGGIYNLYSTAAADNGFMDYLVVHEFGHHFAGLADEYYTSEVAYAIDPNAPEPWEANVTKDPKASKWLDVLTVGVPLPTPWPKSKFEKRLKRIQAQRKRLREKDAPEEELESLFRQEAAWTTQLLGSGKHAGEVGAFEGANYSAKGFYRSQADCLMFTRDDVGFCVACRRAIERVMALYTGR